MEVNKIKKMIKTKNNKDIKTQIDSIKTAGIILMMILVASIVAAMVLVFNNYSTRVQTEIDNMSTTRINNASREVKNGIELRVDENYEQLKTYATFFGNPETYKYEDYATLKKDLKEYSSLYNGFDLIDVIYLDESTSTITRNARSYNSLDGFKKYIASSSEGTLDFFFDASDESIYFGYSCAFENDQNIKGIYGETYISTITEYLHSNLYNDLTAIFLIDVDPNTNNEIISFYDNKNQTTSTMKYESFSQMIADYSQDKSTFTLDYIKDKVLSPNNPPSSILYIESDDITYGSTQVCYISDLFTYTDNEQVNHNLSLRMALIVPQSQLSYQISSLYIESLVIVSIVLGVSGIAVAALILAVCSIAIKQKKYSAYDDNTGLLNITSFKRDAEIIIRQNQETKFALIYITIMKYHFLRQIYDAEYVDGLIAAIGQEIKTNFPNGLNAIGDRNKFIVLIPFEEKKDIIDKITAFQNYMNVFKYRDIHGVELSYGIKRTSFETMTSIDKIIESATLASKYIQYDYTKTNYNFYNAELDRIEKGNAEIELKAQQALDEGRFEVFYQLKRDILEDEWIGAEALVRWRDNDGKLIPPGQFIPIFEENGFVVQIDTYVFENVCKQLREMINNGIKVVPVSVNLSKKHFRDLNFINVYEDIVNEYNIPHELIEFEITEGLLFENINVFKRFIGIAHSRGYKCSMDDFGSGYSSLNIISELDFDAIKIDQRFFRNSNGFTEESKIIISSIISLCHKLGKKVVAEGAEEFEQVKFLKNNECDIIQSYYYSKPIPYNEYKEKLNSEK